MDLVPETSHYIYGRRAPDLRTGILSPSLVWLLLILLSAIITLQTIRVQANGLPCRFGITAPLGVGGYESALQAMDICAVLDWGNTRPLSLPSSIEYVHVLRVSDAHYPTILEDLDTLIPAHPGSMWVVGNEPDTCYGGQDCIYPASYGNRYYTIASKIRSLDPTARIGFGTVVQPTPIRLRYLDRAWSFLVQRAGSEAAASALIDVWTIHSFILNEWPLEWGTGVPPGFESDYADAVHITNLADTHNNNLFNARVVSFRDWMDAKGERGKPLWITEYGSLFPPIDDPYHNYVNVTDMETARYMRESFDFLLGATDAATGDPSDGDRLVQRWFWYSLNGHRYQFGGTLFDPDQSGARTLVGLAFDDYIQQLSGVGQAAGTVPKIFRMPASISAGELNMQWFASVEPDLLGRDGAAFRYVIWLQLPDGWQVPWARQYSYSGDFADTNLVRDYSSLGWIQNAALCPLGGPAEPGYSWRVWFGPLESYPQWMARSGNQLNLRGGLYVPTGASPSIHAVRVVVGTHYDSDRDDVLDTFACQNAAQTLISVP